jgi:hypothetical protein
MILLNKTGLKLLRQFYKLPATMTLGGSGSGSTVVTFSYPRIRVSAVYTDAESNTDTFSQLTMSGVPRGAKVVVACVRRGCTPRHAVLKLKGNNITPFTKPFLRLRGGASAYLEILKPGWVGYVLKITNPPGGFGEKDQRLCLPPGARRPSRCAR